MDANKSENPAVMHQLMVGGKKKIIGRTCNDNGYWEIS